VRSAQDSAELTHWLSAAAERPDVAALLEKPTFWLIVFVQNRLPARSPQV